MCVGGRREYHRSLNEKSEGGYDVMASYSTLYIIGTQYNGDYTTHLSLTLRKEIHTKS